MAGTGLQGAYGLQSLDDLLRQRMQDQLAAQAVAEKTREFNVGAAERTRAHDLSTQQHALATKELESRNAQAAQARTDTGTMNLLQHATPGTRVSDQEAGRINSLAPGMLTTAPSQVSGGETQGLSSFPPQETAPPTFAPGYHELSQGGFGSQQKGIDAARQAAEKRTEEAAKAAEDTRQVPNLVMDRQGNMVDKGTVTKGARITTMPAPPAPPAVQLITTVDENGQPTQKFVPKTAGSAFAKAPPSLLENRLAGATANLQTAKDITDHLNDPGFAANFGPVMGRAGNAFNMIGNAPPEYRRLMGTIHSFALSSLAVHGMRSEVAAENIQHDLSAINTPEALKEYVNGLTDFSRHLLTNAGRPPAPETPSGETGAVQRWGRDAQGRPVRIP